jgi:hypothetical protein
MWEYSVHKVGFDQFCRFADCIALDQLGHFRADHMSPQQFTGFGVEYGFNEAFCFAQRDGFAVTDKREIANFYLIASFLGLGFGQADAGNLRVAICFSGPRRVDDHRQWLRQR